MIKSTHKAYITISLFKDKSKNLISDVFHNIIKMFSLNNRCYILKECEKNYAAISIIKYKSRD